MMYFFLFSSPATVLAVSPARAAMSTKSIFGGTGSDALKAAGSLVSWARVNPAISKLVAPNAAIVCHKEFVLMDALRGYCKIHNQCASPCQLYNRAKLAF